MHLRLKMKFLGAILVHPVRRQILLAKCTLDSTTSETVSYAADAQQDFHMRINAHGSAYMRIIHINRMDPKQHGPSGNYRLIPIFRNSNEPVVVVIVVVVMQNPLLKWKPSSQAH